MPFYHAIIGLITLLLESLSDESGSRWHPHRPRQLRRAPGILDDIRGRDVEAIIAAANRRLSRSQDIIPDADLIPNS